MNSWMAGSYFTSLTLSTVSDIKTSSTHVKGEMREGRKKGGSEGRRINRIVPPHILHSAACCQTQ